MKTFKYFALFSMVLFLFSCGGSGEKESNGEKEIILEPEVTTVSGDMEGCFTVIDRKYKAIGNWSKEITIEIKRTEKKLPFELNGRELSSFYTHSSSGLVKVGFGIEYLDADGNILYKEAANSYNCHCEEDHIALCKLKSWKKGSIRFSIDNDDVKDAVKFRITSAYEELEGSADSASESSSSSDVESSSSDDDTSSSDDDSSSSDDDSSSVSSDSGSEDWDALLRSYDEYVTKYISLVKKAAKGDMSALTEYPALLEKAQEFSDKMSGAQGDMSSAQWAKYMRITNKLAKAAQNM